MTVKSHGRSLELFQAALAASRPGRPWHLRLLGYTGMVLWWYFLVVEFLFSLGCVLALLYFLGAFLLGMVFG